MRSSRAVVFVVLLLLASLAARGETAEESYSLPLDGYCHPGRYMPVRVVATPVANASGLLVQAEDSIWAGVRSGGMRIDAVAPFMPLTPSVRRLTGSWLQHPGKPIEPELKPLNDDQRLVGFGGVGIESADATAIAAALFPKDQVIPQRLDVAQPLRGVAACWEALDLVVLDRATLDLRVGEPKFAALVALGTAFAVRDDPAGPPFPRWPWRRQGGWWTIRYVPAGPRNATFNEQVYAPVSYFPAGWPASARWRFVLYAVVAAVVMLALALWRPRFTAIWAVVLGAAMATVIVFFLRHDRPLRTAEGKIRIVGPQITQDDDWAYQTAPARAGSHVRWVDTLHLFVASPAQWRGMDARVECYPNGDPDILSFSLDPKAKVAILARRCGPQAPLVTPTTSAVTSPMERLVRSLYLAPGDRVLGEVPASPLIGEAYFHTEMWPAVVIRRGDATSP